MPENGGFAAAIYAVHAGRAVQVVQQCRGLLERTLAGLFRAAELCAPYLDGRYNVDAAEVLEGDAAATVEAALEPGEEGQEGQGESLGPEVTLLIAGAPRVLCVLCSAGWCCVDLVRGTHATITNWYVDNVRVWVCKILPDSYIVYTPWRHAGSWCTVKEIGATLATLITRVPIIAEVPRDAAASAGGPDGADGTGFLSNAQVRSIGEHFVDSLCTLKHNGATRKLEQRFEAVCKRLLRQQDAGLAALPQLWLQRVLAFLQRPGQTRSDIVRRSAGVPSAVVAICQAEPTGAAKRLLPIALRVLLDAAQGPAASGEPWPLVHAYNCLRTVFESSVLAMDAAAVFAEGIQVSVHGMSAEEWEVRSPSSR